MGEALEISTESTAGNRDLDACNHTLGSKTSLHRKATVGIRRVTTLRAGDHHITVLRNHLVPITLARRDKCTRKACTLLKIMGHCINGRLGPIRPRCGATVNWVHKAHFIRTMIASRTHHVTYAVKSRQVGQGVAVLASRAFQLLPAR